MNKLGIEKTVKIEKYYFGYFLFLLCLRVVSIQCVNVDKFLNTESSAIEAAQSLSILKSVDIG